MRISHVRKRNNNYEFVYRIPVDLRHHFPVAVIHKSLKTSDTKQATVLASAMERDTQQLILQLRSGMLSKAMEQQILNAYLCHNTRRLRCQATGEPYTPMETNISPVDGLIHGMCKAISDWSSSVDAVTAALPAGVDAGALRDAQAAILGLSERAHKETLRAKQLSPSDDSGAIVEAIARTLKSQKIKGLSRGLSEEEKRVLGVKIAALQLELEQAERGLCAGDWTPLEALQSKAARAKKGFVLLRDAIKKYLEYHRSSNPAIRVQTRAAIEVECRLLNEMLGNISVDDANTMDSVTKLKQVLRQYPQNRAQRFPGRTLASILKSGLPYAKIKPLTANRYIARMASIIDYAAKQRWTATANVYKGERFADNEIASEKRLPYDEQDLERLTDALCSKPMWVNGENRDERFWVVLICLYQGLRLGNVVTLTKRHISTIDGVYCFDLRESGSKGSKTAATAQSVLPLHPALREIGLVRWIEGLEREQLFRDTAKQVSVWYNRREQASPGFEPRYITTDPRKCLYSTRHVFGSELYQATGNMKTVKEAMGHSVDARNVTEGYVGRSKLERLSSGIAALALPGMDVAKLTKRAKELFNLS